MGLLTEPNSNKNKLFNALKFEKNNKIIKFRNLVTRNRIGNEQPKLQDHPSKQPPKHVQPDHELHQQPTNPKKHDPQQSNPNKPDHQQSSHKQLRSTRPQSKFTENPYQKYHQTPKSSAFQSKRDRHRSGSFTLSRHARRTVLREE